MKCKIKVEPSARLEIQQTITWYNEQQKGLGKRFHEAVKKSLADIRSNPRYQIRYDTFRCKLVKKFPYMIHYEFMEGEKLIIVYAVIHTSRNPDEQWLKR